MKAEIKNDREHILLTEEEFNNILCEDSEYFSVVKEKNGYFDSEKGMVDVQITVKRRSDNKIFSGNYVRGGQGNNWIDDTTLIEVVKKVPPPEMTWEEFLKQPPFNKMSSDEFFVYLTENYHVPKKIKS